MPLYLSLLDRDSIFIRFDLISDVKKLHLNTFMAICIEQRVYNTSINYKLSSTANRQPAYLRRQVLWLLHDKIPKVPFWSYVVSFWSLPLTFRSQKCNNFVFVSAPSKLLICWNSHERFVRCVHKHLLFDITDTRTQSSKHIVWRQKALCQTCQCQKFVTNDGEWWWWCSVNLCSTAWRLQTAVHHTRFIAGICRLCQLLCSAVTKR